MSNETHGILFPGYSAYGDSLWRTSITPLPVESEPRSFHRRVAQVEGTVEPLRWKLGYKWDHWNREHRRVEDSTENGLLTSLDYSPTKSFYAVAAYRYFTRKADRYAPGVLEYTLLRMFDQARRIRQQANYMMTWQAHSRVSIAGTLFYTADNYDKTFFGLRQYRTGNDSVDATVTAADNVWIYAGFSRERTGYDYATMAKTATPWDLRNAWNRDTRDRITSANFGLSCSFAENKGAFDLQYSSALARALITTTNPFVFVPADANSARAHPFPEVKNQFHELRLNVSYKVSPKYTVGLYYLFEPYRLKDFANDTLSAYPAETLAPEVDLRRFVFLDTGPSNYTGNVAAFICYIGSNRYAQGTIASGGKDSPGLAPTTRSHA